MVLRTTSGVVSVANRPRWRSLPLAAPAILVAPPKPAELIVPRTIAPPPCENARRPANCGAGQPTCRVMRQGGANGEMAERFKAPVLKTGEGSNLPWVRIPLSPPILNLSCKVRRRDSLSTPEAAARRVLELALLFAQARTVGTPESMPSSGTRTPSSDTGAPSSDTGAPSSDTGAPSSDTRAPSSDTRAPSSDTRTPSSDTGAPSSDTRTPSSDTQRPSSDTRPPSPDTQRSSSGDGVMLTFWSGPIPGLDQGAAKSPPKGQMPPLIASGVRHR